MSILVSCPCGQCYPVREDFAGQVVRCAGCGNVLTVPHTVSGPRLKLPPPPSAPSSTPILILIVVLLLTLVGAGIFVVVNLDRLEEWFGKSRQTAARDEDEDTKPGDKKPADDVPVVVSKDDKKTDGSKPPPVIEPPPEKKEPPPMKVDPPPMRVDPPPDRKEPPPKKVERPWLGHSATIHRLGTSSDGLHVLSASGGTVDEDGKALPALDSSLRLWDARTGEQKKLLRGFVQGLSSAAFSHDGKFALFAGAGKRVGDKWTAGADHDLHLWDLNEEREIRLLQGHLAEVLCIVFSSDGRFALSGGRDRIARLWEVGTGRELQRLVGHTGSINALAFSPDGKQALTGSTDLTARVWDLDRGVELRQLAGHQDIVWAAAISTSGNHAITGGGYQVDPEKKSLKRGSQDFAIRLWDFAAGKEIRRFEGHTEAISCLAFSPDGKRVVSTAADKSVRIWQVSSGRLIKKFDGHTQLIRALVLSPDGTRAYSGDDKGALQVWDLPPEQGDLVRQLREGADNASRIKAAVELGLAGADARETMPDLFRAALDSDADLRRACLAAIEQIGKPLPAHLPVVQQFLDKSSPLELRMLALDTLARLGAEAKPAVADIALLLKEKEPALRARAARTLGICAANQKALVRPLLVEGLRDADAAVTKAAREALTALGPPTPDDAKKLPPLLADPSEVVRRYALDSLVALKEEAVAAIPDIADLAAKDASADLRRASLQALADIQPRDAAALAAFNKALTDRDVAVARQAVQGLLRAGVDVCLVSLLGALKHPDAEIVKTVDETLQKTMWEKGHAKALGEALAAAPPAYRERFLAALGTLGADAAAAVPGLRALLKQPDAKDLLAVVQTVAKIGAEAKAAAAELQPLLKRDPKIKDFALPLEVAHTLVAIGADDLVEAATVLVAGLRIEDEMEASIMRRDHVIESLTKIGKPAVTPLVKSLTGDYIIGNARTPAGSVRAVARFKVIETLAAIGPPHAATPEVFKILAFLERNEPYVEVRQAATAVKLKLMMKDDPEKKDAPPKKDDKPAE